MASLLNVYNTMLTICVCICRYVRAYAKGGQRERLMKLISTPRGLAFAGARLDGVVCCSTIYLRANLGVHGSKAN